MTNGTNEPWRVFDIDGREVVDLDAMAWAFRVARAIQVGFELKLFQGLLEGPLSAADLSAACETHEPRTERLLVLLAATGLLFREPDGRFRLTDAGRAAFDPASPTYFGWGLAHATQGWARWDHLADEVRHGPGGQPGGGGRPPFSDEGHRIFVGAMHDYSIRGRAQWLAGCVDLRGRAKLLDLGGGPGTYSIALCERYRDLRAVIFDQPATEPIARETVAQFGLSDRIDFLGGDWNTDAYGEGYDCALLSNVLHGPGTGSEDRLRRVHEVLAPEGLLIVQDFLLDNDRNGPLSAAVFNVHVGTYTVGEMITVIRQAGYRNVTLLGRGPAGNGLVVANRV